MGRNFTDFLAGAGYFLLDTTREAVLRHDDETAQQEREAGISILTAALYESKIKDTEIVRLLQKYICITDMAAAKSDNSRAADDIKNWLRKRNTLEFLGTWEQIYNPSFKVVEFDHFKQEAGLHTFTLSVSDWAKCGLEVGESYNKPKSDDARQPQCTPEKEEAIMQALSHFGVI